MNERRFVSESASDSDQETEPDTDRLLICNPASGSGDHAPDVRARGAKRGFEVRETRGPGDARRFAREAALHGNGNGDSGGDCDGDGNGNGNSSISVIAVAGGDGTVNEVIHGLREADALDRVDVAIVPTGTANVFARTLGIPDADAGFDAIDAGTSRRIDVGIADGQPFINTCLAGLSAEANATTPDEWKRQFGSFAYVLTTLRLLPEYDGVPLEIRVTDGETACAGASGGDTDDDGTPSTWRGNALLVLVGNAFRLPTVSRRPRSPMSDGTLEVVVLETGGDDESLEENDVSGALDADPGTIPGPVTRFEASSLSIATRADDGAPVNFSLDGEPLSATELELSICERRLSVLAEPAESTRNRWGRR
ncbi:diacylglycerol kinase domain protein (plasmid) [Natrialba magadii ATCC 43099]|uniref:Diacylglycerol kinase catalytic subunit n=1 Tax=Natrialba magadii (strain ATCC 43099 / DSM 3394 / CCM 3739 / CIP 104546 / IAM 13178 / JCM 8861 / NBRC 102185 / NCIMB 2190 / MS3) TaxID=547559 RepID=D3T197_NATMM|nr:diacylglycerol kinase family protein [Natrialba magadii]ADD07356.1 diacylglycerol kinase domain protein [Natrialba magadii ATCC 43099]ELY32611.1 diacylglycerol kinase catalytic subunit [Natrialba magadii ATCC 43099]